MEAIYPLPLANGASGFGHDIVPVSTFSSFPESHTMKQLESMLRELQSSENYQSCFNG